ncbi:putative glycosyl transferase [Herminiimonas arsenicoxydans]|uniref:Glycosyl transferase n=1 Tax=Herminiimonas arsenicoxydans TaxID=204773 RepID=A4G2D8_HERAR|nr:putative glycosyl transferase [Herminiimonas arsenicoxydans]
MSISAADVTVVVVTYNSAHCMAGLASALSVLPHLTIVDNASDDDTIAQVAIHMPNAKIIRNERNLGFGAANNRALLQAQTAYALLLNPDCLPAPNFLRDLLAVADQYQDAAIIAPHLIRRGGEVEVSYRWPVTHWTSAGPAADAPCCVGFVCGAVMLLNMPVMREIGFFDETFFLYYEDEDLCQRVFMQKKQIIVAPQVSVTHLSRGSVKGPSPWRAEFGRGYHHAQSKLIFTRKHFGVEHVAALRWKTMGLALLNLLPRLLLPFPRYLARLLGRICGLFQYKP